MGKLFLAGHTGSINRGCEAIVRSTVKLFNSKGITDITLFSDNISDDKKVRLDTVCDIVPYTKSKRYSLKKVAAKSIYKATGNYMPEEQLHQGVNFKLVSPGDIVMVIGGDTYCYGRPVTNYAANRLAKKRGARTVLWGCSIEDGLITDEMIRDLNRYDLICPREAISFNTLLERGIPESKMLRISDPAFNLPVHKTEYPEIMDKGRTVGINISPVIYRDKDSYKAVLDLIEHILNDTVLNILLIPHVYEINRVDSEVLADIYNRYKSTGKISIIDNSLSCTELKYIISKCRIFIGARTHSTIAAYSSCVPTLVLGYSVKSRGIAVDLFGTDKNYVLMSDELGKNNDLINAFDYIDKNHDLIENSLKSKLSDYKKSTGEAVKKIIEWGKLTPSKKLYFSKKNCSGCSACKTVCPKQCIDMKRDENGFLYPEADSNNCIDCGKCERVCYYRHRPDKKEITSVYAAINKNEDIRMTSSSGGVFHALAEEVISDGGIVFGAGFDADFNVRHISVEAVSELYRLHGSKYVESDIGDCFADVKKQLDTGRKVLFTGTPCQINGLMSYLGGNHEALLTMDFICHGVPSPLVWRKYLDEMEQKYSSKVCGVSFRNKTHGWKVFSMIIEFENGQKYIGKVTEDPYLRSFISDIHLRKSCTSCMAKGTDRPADITVADFWGVGKVIDGINDDKGTSVIITRGNKADSIIETVSDSLRLYRTDIDTVVKLNPSINKSVTENPLSEGFFRTLRKSSFSQTYDKYCSMKTGAKIRRKLGKLKR